MQHSDLKYKAIICGQVPKDEMQRNIVCPNIAYIFQPVCSKMHKVAVYHHFVRGCIYEYT